MPLNQNPQVARHRYEDFANWRLVDLKRKLELFLGDKAKTINNERVEILQTHPPLKSGSQGKVTVKFIDPSPERKITTMTYFPSVIDAEFQYVGELS